MNLGILQIMGLWAFLEGILLFVNSLAILNEDSCSLVEVEEEPVHGLASVLCLYSEESTLSGDDDSLSSSHYLTIQLQ
ncbi:hypothetical protein SADUNF_Sadunf16G0092000 [Salix dunnii]|uniref:Uncharacterized protein n=1 Tax=Salix dunnii TaxID=1413687 RepID=A0A835MIN3_9ROSI|nr:hypothetical protein SADUNF_Sadunf16G0092000 [Salix dunnii]